MKAGSVPSLARLQETYRIFLHGFSAASKDARIYELIVTSASWSRIDARLGEILVATLTTSFHSLNPFELWSANQRSALPAALGVVLEFVEEAVSNDASKERLRSFRAWRSTALFETKPAEHQLFFVNDGLPKPSRAFEDISLSLAAYLKWGFWAKDSLLSSKRPQKRPLSRTQRQMILQTLLAQRSSLTVTDYLAACDHRVLRRTAERDLANHTSLRASGRTQARCYKVVTTSGRKRS